MLTRKGKDVGSPPNIAHRVVLYTEQKREDVTFDRADCALVSPSHPIP